MAATDSISTVNQSSKLVDMSFQIEELKLDARDVREINIRWGGLVVRGDVTINDLYDAINTTSIKPGTQFVLDYTDPHNDKHKRKFEVLAANERKEQDNKYMTFHFQDVISLTLERTYMAKSWAETTLTEVINFMFKEIPIDPLLAAEKMTKEFDQTPNKRKNFIVPTHMNFLDFIQAEVAKEGWFFYQFRDKIFLKKDGTIGPHAYPYKQVSSNDVYGFKVMSYRCKHFNGETTGRLPKTEYWCFDKTTKSMIKHKKYFEDYKNDWKKSTTMRNFDFTKGTRVQTWEYIHDNTEFANMVYKENTVLEIVVPGNVKYNLLWRDMDLQLEGGKMSKTTSNRGDVVLSGIYNCFKIEDKFLFGAHFIQKLSVKRVDQGDPL